MPAKLYTTDEERRNAKRACDRRYRSTETGKAKRRAATAAYRRRLVALGREARARAQAQAQAQQETVTP